jgi:hypothetical protein
MFAMKIEKFQLRGNYLVSAGAFQLLRGRTPALLGGNIGHYPPSMETPVHCRVHKSPQTKLKLHFTFT